MMWVDFFVESITRSRTLRRVYLYHVALCDGKVCSSFTDMAIPYRAFIVGIIVLFLCFGPSSTQEDTGQALEKPGKRKLMSKIRLCQVLLSPSSVYFPSLRVRDLFFLPPPLFFFSWVEGEGLLSQYFASHSSYVESKILLFYLFLLVFLFGVFLYCFFLFSSFPLFVILLLSHPASFLH